MATYLEIEQVVNAYSAKKRAIALSRTLFDAKKGDIIMQDITAYAFPISAEPLRTDSNGNEVWGLKCLPTDEIEIHTDIDENFMFAMMASILPHRLKETNGVATLTAYAQQFLALRDDPEQIITMAMLAGVSDGAFVEVVDE